MRALGLDKDELVQACGLSFTVSTIALAGVLAHDGVLDPSVAGASLLALAPALAGMALGQWVRSRADSREPGTFFSRGWGDEPHREKCNHIRGE